MNAFQRRRHTRRILADAQSDKGLVKGFCLSDYTREALRQAPDGKFRNVVINIIKVGEKRVIEKGLDPTIDNILMVGYEGVEVIIVQDILGWPRAGWDRPDETSLRDAITLYLLNGWSKIHPEVKENILADLKSVRRQYKSWRKEAA